MAKRAGAAYGQSKGKHRGPPPDVWPPPDEHTDPHVHAWMALCSGCGAHAEIADAHYVTFEPTSWSVEHSLTCRLDGHMAGCAFHKAIEAVGYHPTVDMMGRWEITELDEMGLPSLRRVVE